ncbi:MAG: UDP-3-O-(3-hydroxymyristoyl)glucosamine N-acyltransferase, partial [Gammaproteobacteria bacterium]|nr:UDP-3-O-(3-hydroxymyristoyl)glucosamine N-acyltransferase [Gammaproteobacteria bacterium]
ANAFITSKSSIGDNSWIGPGVMVLNQSTVGLRAIINSGAVIGADGFGFSEDENSQWVKVPQTGSVKIGNDVEIGANTTIDRGTMTDTQLKNGVKLDNLIQVGHNVIIGEHTAIVANSQIAGSSVIGKHCKISGHVSITGHIEIADHTTLTGRTAVMKSIKEPGVYSSNLFPHQKTSVWQKNVAIFRSLSKLKSIISSIKIKEDNESDT